MWLRRKVRLNQPATTLHRLLPSTLDISCSMKRFLEILGGSSVNNVERRSLKEESLQAISLELSGGLLGFWVQHHLLCGRYTFERWFICCWLCLHLFKKTEFSSSWHELLVGTNRVLQSTKVASHFDNSWGQIDSFVNQISRLNVAIIDKITMVLFN